MYDYDYTINENVRNDEVNEKGGNDGGSGFYTNKHQTLAAHLSVDCYMIKNENDEIFILKNTSEQEFWVLTDEEAFEYLVNEIDISFEMPFKEFPLKDVTETLGIEEEEIKEFFLPEILIGEVSFKYNAIDSDVLLKYLENNYGVNFFIQNYARLLLDQGRSGEILCYKNFNTKKNDYNIYIR